MLLSSEDAGNNLCFCSCFYRCNVDVCTTVLASCEYYSTVCKSVQCVVFANTNVLACMVYSTALTLDDVTSLCKLTTKNLYSESLAF